MSEETVAEFKDIKINFRVPVNMPSHMAHHLFVQDLGDYYQLLFFEIGFPLIPPTTSPEDVEKIQDAGLYAECVAKINVLPARFKAFTDAMRSVAEAQKDK